MTPTPEREGEGQPQHDCSQHWTVKALDKALETVIKAGNDLCFAAETSGGTAGRDEHIQLAILHWVEARKKAQFTSRIVRFEGGDHEIGAGRLDHPLRIAGDHLK